MRTIINMVFVAASFASISALACPNLAGEYTHTGGTREHPIVWTLKVTQKGCESVTYVSIPSDNPEAAIRNEKVADGNCFVYKIDPNSPGESCFSYRFEGDALLGETFDREGEGMPWIRASQLRITRAANGNLAEELFEGRGGDLSLTAGWQYQLKR